MTDDAMHDVSDSTLEPPAGRDIDAELERRLARDAAFERAARPPHSIAPAVELRIAARRVHGLAAAALAASIVLVAGVGLGLAWASADSPSSVSPGSMPPSGGPPPGAVAQDELRGSGAAHSELARSLSILGDRVDRRLRRESNAALEASLGAGARLADRFTRQLDDKLALLTPRAADPEPSGPPA